MKTLLTSIICLLLISCSSTDNKGQVQSLSVLQYCTLGEFAFGEGKRSRLEAALEDRSSSEAYQGRMNELLSLIQSIDSLSYPLMSELNTLRTNIVEYESSQENSGERDHKPNYPVSMDYSSNMILTSSALPGKEDVKRIIREIELYRNYLCTIIVETYPNLFDGSDPQFVIPNISTFKNDLEKKKIIELELKKSQIADDDKIVVSTIMNILTKSDDDWEAMIMNYQNWVNYSMSLLSIQNIILQARSEAFSWVIYNMGCVADYNFTNFSPIIIGSSKALPNETVQFEVFSGAYNAYANPDVNIFNGGRLIKTEFGKAYIETVVPESGDVEIKGEIIYVSKSGERRATKWTHKIQVIKAD